MILLLGSRAAKEWFPDFRKPKDWDAIASIETIFKWSQQNESLIDSLMPKSSRKMFCKLKDGNSIEFEILSQDVSTTLLAEQANTFRPCAFPCNSEALAITPTLLYLTKRSHLHWAIHWKKNIEDMHWLKSKSKTPSVSDLEYFNARLSEHQKRFKKNSTKLNMSNQKFFQKSERIVHRVIEHDRLHELVAYQERPLFESFKKDLDKAMLSKELFDIAPFDQKLSLVREEAMVIALERYIIPSNFEANIEDSYRKALQRICTTLTSGWFRDFAIDSWPLVSTPDKDFSIPIKKELALKECVW